MKKYLIVSLLALSALGYADDAVNLQDLDQRLKIAESKLELKADASLSAGPNGFILQSADKKWSLKIGGMVQIDSRNYFDEVSHTAFASNNALNNTELPRRIRLQIDTGLGERAKLRIQEDLVGNLVDAYGELKLFPWATLRTGLFKTPLSLERWRSDPARDFVELGYTSALVTDRDTGALLDFADADQVIDLSVGVFNGTVDTGSIVTADADDDKDVVAKFFTHPFRAFDIVSLRDLGLGIAASSGDRNTAVATPSYKSLGQSSINVFSYKSTVLASGASLRVVPQAYWFWRNLSFLGEYVRSSQAYQNSANLTGTADTAQATLSNEAWQAQLAWDITGEDTAFGGFKLNQDSYSWGALQLATRYEGLRFDDESFDRIPLTGSNTLLAGAGRRFADRRTSVSGVQSWGVSLSYLPVNNVKLLLDWEESHFTDGAWTGSSLATSPSATTSNRDTEKVFFARAQFTF